MFNRQQPSLWFTVTVENTKTMNVREEWTINAESASMARRQVKEELGTKNQQNPGWKIVRITKA